jgi:CHAT domain-containing protein
MGEEIANSWRLDAELVTLSACDTALGRNVGSEGVIGFAYPFLAAGARSLLVSQWKVDDEATALFMGRYYREWLGDVDGSASGREGKSKVEALQATRQWLRDYKDSSGERPYEHPYYWAAFILIGSGS